MESEMKVLIIDNNVMKESWGSSDLKRFVLKDPRRAAYVRRGPHDDIPHSIRNYDKMILSGSLTSCLAEGPWIAKLDDLIRECLDAGKPILGVCFGHQALIRATSGRNYLRRGATPEYGWTEIHRLENESKLFEGLPNKFYSYSSHVEEVSELPPGMKLLAKSELCGIQAYEVAGKPAYGIQFHPERNLEEAKSSIKNKLSTPDGRYVLNPTQSDKLYDPSVGDKIFENFLKL